MELKGSSAGDSGTGLAELGTQSSNKKKACVDSVYSCGLSFKKLKKPAAGNVIDLFAGSLSLENVEGTDAKPVVSWGSEIGSVFSSMSNLLDAKNVETMVAEEVCYAGSGEDDNIDEAMPKRTRTQTCTLDNPPKQPVFEHISNDNSVLKLPLCVSGGPISCHHSGHVP
ncbi:hypothetical protein G9A89_002267 [Geosiphon pyriformis]|nr:hypothetical protein G9A89_002267 [Geosiphon pyriformis]